MTASQDVTVPDLNFPAWEPQHERELEQSRARVAMLRERLERGEDPERNARWLAMEERDLRVREASRPERTRARVRDTDGRYRSTERVRGGQRRVAVHRAGLVELVNEADPFDYRVSFRWNEETDNLEVGAVAIIARPGESLTATKLREARIGTAILDAGRLLTTVWDDEQPGGARVGKVGDVRMVLASEEAEGLPLRRRSSAQVRRERDAAHEIAAAYEGPRYGRNQFIAGKLSERFPGFRFTAQTAADRLRDR